MKHIQSIYNDVPKTKGYLLCKQKEKDIADAIYKDMCAKSSTKAVFNIPKGCQGARVIRALMVRHFPYTCIYKRWYEVEKLSNGTRNLTITTKYFRLYMKRNTELKQKIADIVNELKITDNTDDYTKAKKLADYVAEHCLYDFDDKSGEDAYFCLCRGLTICCGYSEGYKALCDYCGLTCQILEGDGHAWNRVKINGKWLYVDTTWVSLGSSKEKYFLQPNKVFYSDHMAMEKKCVRYWRYEE